MESNGWLITEITSMSGPEILYVGEFRRNLDAKNRLTVPAKWRFPGDDADVYVGMPSPDGSIIVRPPQQMKQFLDKLSQVSSGNLKLQQMLNQIYSMAHSFGCDKQGRINLNDKLLQQAGITKDVVLLGGMNVFKIWDAGQYDQALSDTLTPESYAQALEEMGL